NSGTGVSPVSFPFRHKGWLPLKHTGGTPVPLPISIAVPAQYKRFRQPETDSRDFELTLL
ncbi:MAG: hypothetical protein DME19_05535, partial [Verrucomicrobia bacterium]